MAKVSVIIPVHNNEEYLPRAVESVLWQSFQDFEIIIVDDGSTDRSAEIARDYALRHPGRISTVRQENRGPGAARNTGLRRVRGKYIAFLDADDRWEESKLRKQAAILDLRPDIGLVHTDFRFVDEEDRPVEHVKDESYNFPRGEITLSLFSHFSLYTSLIMVRRVNILQAGFFREDIRIAEDYDYVLRLSTFCRVEGISQPLLVKTMRTNALSIDTYKNGPYDARVLTEFLASHPGFHARNRRAVSVLMGKRFFSLGYSALKKGEKRASLRYFWVSLRYRPSLKPVKGILQSAFPVSMIEAARAIIRGRAGQSS